MDKKRIILLSSLLGLAIALLGVLLLVLGRGNGSQPAVAAQPVLTQTAVITAAPTAEPTAAPTEDPRLMLSFGPVDRGVKELILSQNESFVTILAFRTSTFLQYWKTYLESELSPSTKTSVQYMNG